MHKGENPSAHKEALTYATKDTHRIGKDQVQYRNRTDTRSDGSHRPKPAKPAGPHTPGGKSGMDNRKTGSY